MLYILFSGTGGVESIGVELEMTTEIVNRLQTSNVSRFCNPSICNSIRWPDACNPYGESRSARQCNYTSWLIQDSGRRSIEFGED